MFFFARVKVWTPSLRGCGDLMLFRRISRPSPPPETRLGSSPGILLPALLHPYRANDHGSGQLPNAVVSSALLSDSGGSIALDGTQAYLLGASPPRSADRLMWFWNRSIKVYKMCAISHFRCMITGHIAFGVDDYSRGCFFIFHWS